MAYAAVGRRLGYPIKLACSKEHMFCRWEGMDHPNPGWRDRFNFDGAGKGFSIDPDEFYLSWPRKSTPEQVEVCDWLKSLTPQQELGHFVVNRGHVFAHVAEDQGRALVAYSEGARLWRNRATLQEVAEMFTRPWEREAAAHPGAYTRLQKMKPSGGTDAVAALSPPRARSARDPMADLDAINEANRISAKSMNQSLGVAQAQVPSGQPGAVQSYQSSMPGQLPR